MQLTAGIFHYGGCSQHLRGVALNPSAFGAKRTIAQVAVQTDQLPKARKKLIEKLQEAQIKP